MSIFSVSFKKLCWLNIFAVLFSAQALAEGQLSNVPDPDVDMPLTEAATGKHCSLPASCFGQRHVNVRIGHIAELAFCQGLR